MYPDEIQPYVKSRIETHPQFANLPWKTGQMLGGVDNLAIPGVILDDGLYPKTPGFEQTLTTCGLAIIAWRVGALGLKDVADTGMANILMHVPVLIQENQKINRDPGNPNATKITAERAMQYVIEAVSGFPKIGPTNPGKFTPILLWHDPFEDFGVLNGLRTIMLNFSKQHRTHPLAA